MKRNNLDQSGVNIEWMFIGVKYWILNVGSDLMGMMYGSIRVIIAYLNGWDFKRNLIFESDVAEFHCC